MSPSPHPTSARKPGPGRPEPRQSEARGPAGRRLAAIDVGSNTVRLFAVEMVDAVAWRVLADTKATTRLGRGLAESGRLRADAMRATLRAIVEARTAATQLGCDPVRICATAAVRDARNREDFEELVRKETGETLWVASMADEGRLVHASAGRIFGFAHGSCMTIDLGGGSLEIVQSLDGVIISNTSAMLGAVRLTEQFGGPEDAAGRRFDDMLQAVDEAIKATFDRPVHPPRIVAASGGSAVTVSALCHGDTSSGDRHVPVSRADLKNLVTRLRGATVKQRLAMPGMPEDRADIIPAAALVLHRVMRRLDLHTLHPHDGGVRDGVILTLLAEADRQIATPPTALEGVRAFARSCQYEESHSEQVARLSVQLYDALLAADLLDAVDDRDRELLEAAAVMHDVGCMVEYRRHHKHSHAITLNAPLPGFSDSERGIIAAVARYHRRAEPSPKHRDFAALPAGQREQVCRLAGVLRIADGLDRTHAQEVHSLTVARDGDGIRITPFLRRGTTPLDEQTLVNAATKKSGLLESVLGRPVVIAAGERDRGNG